MQRRVKLDHILRQKHVDYPKSWRKVLQAIGPASPIFNLENFGSIILIDETLYLVISNKYANKWRCIKPMVNIFQYFLMPQCWRLNQHQQSLSEVQNYSIHFVIDYLEKLIQGATQSLFLNIIDLSILGKLIISKNYISYINGEHEWRYQFVTERISLPRLLMGENKQQQASTEMARKFSVSLNKARSLSNKKENEKSRVLKRASSVSNLVQFQPKRTSTDLSNHKRGQPLQKQLEKSKLLLQQQKIKTHQSKQRSKTQASVMMNSKKQSERNKNREYTSSGFKVSNSKQKNVSTQKVIIQVPNETAKPKLKLNRQKSFIPPERKNTTNNEGNEQKLLQRQIQNFILRATSGVFILPSLKSIKQIDILKFIRELSGIFDEKFDQVKKRRDGNYQYYNLKKRIRRNKFQITKNKILHIRLLTAQGQSIFRQFFEFIESYGKRFSNFTKQYIISLEEQKDLMCKFVNQLTSRFQSHSLELSCKIQIGLVLHSFHQNFLKNIQKILQKILLEKSKLILVKTHNQQSFQIIQKQILQTFQCPFIFFQSLIKKLLPTCLHFQPHQLSKIETFYSKISQLLVRSKSQYQKNIAFFKTLQIKMLLAGSYKREKQAIVLIKQLQILKYNIQNEIGFKSQLMIDGIYVKMGIIKDIFLKEIQHKFHQIFNYFFSYYEKTVAELNLKLNATVVVNVDYLSNYKCRQYKQNIEENYNSIVASLMLLIQHLFPLLKQMKIDDYLLTVYSFRQQIRKNFQNFDQKLQEYRKSSVKTIKILQVQNKANKQIYQKLNQSLKKLVNSLTSQKMILQEKAAILQLQSEFQSYSASNQKLAISMKQNEMIYWQDDTYFINQMTLLKKSLVFLEGKNYRNLASTVISELTIQDFITSYEEFTSFIKEIQQNKLEKLFKPVYNLIAANLLLIQIFMYNQYKEIDLDSLRQLGIDVLSEKSNKIITIIKRYQNIEKKRVEAIEEIYRQSRLSQFKKRYQYHQHNLVIMKQKGEFNISYISNVEELRVALQHTSPVKNKHFVEKLELLSKLYLEVVAFNKMITLISDSNLSSEMKNNITEEINTSYQKLLKMNVEVISISILKNKIAEMKAIYMEILFNQKTSIFPRYCLYSIQQIICLSSWENSKDTERNIRILYEQIDNVQVSQQNVIKSLTLAKDHLLFQKPIILSQKEIQKSKSVFISLDGFIRNSLNHSQFASVQIKILFWHIYFTQQVQLQFFSDGNSIQKLKESLMLVVTEIASQIRYDVKLHHMTYQIAQLNIFIAHIDKIKNITALTDFQWVSTIRCYDRAKTTKIQQNQKIFQYGFQPKRPQNINPAFQIQTGITYGFKQSSSYYQESAYILGKPYKTFSRLAEYGFQHNYLNLLNIIKKYCFFLKIIVNQINFTKVNYFHKKIFQMTLKKEQIETQVIKTPIFFEYSNETVFPSCFPEKIRNFRTPQISYDLNLIIYLQLNKIQDQIDKRGIDIAVLHRAISYINKQKSVTLKKVLNFTAKLKQFLMNKEEKQNIYKFCYTHFIVNFEIQTEQLSSILKYLISLKKDSKLDTFISQLKLHFHEFLQDNSKKHIILYGFTSIKSQLLKQLGVVAFCHKRQDAQSTLYHVQGVQQFLQLEKQESLKKYRFAIQDRSIWEIDPSELGNCKLMYINELQPSCIEQIFKNKIHALNIEGSYLILWKMFTIVHSSYVQVCQKNSLLGSMELAVRVFSKHITDYVNELDKNDQDSFQLGINKDLIRSFLIIIHELYYYLTPPCFRKRLVEKIKENSFLQDYRSEDLSSITCKGLMCDKIINFIKKEKSIFSNLNFCQREMMIIKKYLSYGEVTIGVYNSPFQLKMAKTYVNKFEQRKINILFKDQYMHLFSNLKYRNLIYVIEDVHLAKKRKLTFFKNFIQEIQPHDMKYLLFANNHNHQNSMKRHITIHFSQIDVQEVFKFQTKSGIFEVIQQKSRQLWNSHFFASKEEYVQFLLKTTAKLPAQSYRKYYARYLVYSKLSLAEKSLKIIEKTQEYLAKQIDYNSLGLYLQPTGSQQFCQLQFTKKIERFLAGQSSLNKIIAKEHYNKVLPYTFAQKITIVVEEVFLLPMIIAHLSQKKIFRLKTHQFIQQLVNIIQTMYYQDKEFYLIVEEPLASSQIWLEWYYLYLNQLDIINYYEQLTQFTDELVSKQEFIHRQINLNIEIKDKIQDLLQRKMKIVVSVDLENNKLYNVSYVQHQRAIFFNCTLDKETKLKIADSITDKIIRDQKENIRNIILPYKSLFVELVDLELISLKKLEHFLLDIIEHSQLQVAEQQKRKEDTKQKLRLLQSVITIKQHLKEEVCEEEKKVSKAKNILEEVMTCIGAYKKIEIPQATQQIYFQELSKIRANFFNLQEKNVIELKTKKHQQLFTELKEIFLGGCLTIYHEYVLLNLTSQCILQVIGQKILSAMLLKVYQKYNHAEIQDFILFRYFKYILNIVEEYQKFSFNEIFLQKEISQINYFYLLDVSIQLKNKYEVIINQSEAIFGKLKLIDSLKDILTSIYHMNFSQEQLFSYSMYKRFTKIIRNYVVEQSQYPLQSLLARYSNNFKDIQSQMDQYILEEHQREFESFSRDLFKQQKSLIVYDPYWRMERLCEEMKIKIIYINSENDLHRVYGYQFQMTVFCLRLTTVKGWKQHRRLIDECLDIIQHKHSDLKQNIMQKLVISINNKAILQQINIRFPLLNLDFSLMKFHDLLRNQIRNKQHHFEEIKKNYKEIKRKLVKEIEMMKKLDSSQMFLYIMTLQFLLQEYRQKHGEMLSVVDRHFLNAQEQHKIQQIYKSIIKLSKSNEIPFNYTLRLIKRINPKQLLRKVFSIESQKDREQQLLKLLHLSRWDKISDQVEQCLLVSRFIVVFFQSFNKKTMKELIKLEQGSKYQVRIIIEINQKEIEEFLYSKSTLNLADQTSAKEIVFLFIKPVEIYKIGQLINKCSVIWT